MRAAAFVILIVASLALPVRAVDLLTGTAATRLDLAMFAAWLVTAVAAFALARELRRAAPLLSHLKQEAGDAKRAAARAERDSRTARGSLLASQAQAAEARVAAASAAAESLEAHAAELHHRASAADANSAVSAAEDMARDLLTIDELRERYIDTVGHELRNPLTAIKGYLQALADEDSRHQLPAPQREYVEIASRSAAHLQEMIEDLLDTSGPHFGGTDHALGPVDATGLLLEVLEEFGAVASRRGLVVEPELSGGLEVIADRIGLAQVFSNLVSNAIKYSRPGGLVEVRAVADGQTTVVEVTDQGVGIPADELRFVGRRNFRASTARGVPGQGMGLAITGEIVERLGGSLEFESREGVGSTFRVSLPAPEERAPQVAQTESLGVPRFGAASRL